MTASLESLEPLGDRAVRIAIVSADEGRALAAALRASGDVDDAWHTETHLALTPRPGVDPRALVMAADRDPAVQAALWGDAAGRSAREHALPVVLDGPDLDDVADAARLSRRAVERLLLDAALTVSFLGFSPGFGYLRGLDPRLHLRRRATPRPRVPAGSLALAGGFAAIYPGATAGGWHLVGRALAPLWRDGEPLLADGDRVRLVEASAAEVAAFAAGEPAPAGPGRGGDDAPALVVQQVRGLAFVQDGGRRGRLHQGMPPAGALLPSALARANRAAGNPDGAAGLERYGALRLAATAPVTVATDDGLVVALAAGESLELPWSATVRAGYLAIGGGLDVPLVAGGRGTHVRAGLGGHHGRPLRRGDHLPLLSSLQAPRARQGGPARPTSEELAPTLTVVPGPDLARFAPGALDVLLATPWRLSHTSDRMGTRLDGATLAHAAVAHASSAPLVLGAIEVPPDGVPVVLGPEHPTTGGYPVVAVVVARDLDAFHRQPLGRAVRFRLPG